MAQLTFAVTSVGLAVPAFLGPDATTIATRIGVPQTTPSLVPTRGLLDTGSDLTAVAPWVLKQLAIPSVGTATTHTAAGPVHVPVYQVSLSITDPTRSSSPFFTVPVLVVTELPITLPDVDVLVGLNALLLCKLVLEGLARQFSLEF